MAWLVSRQPKQIGNTASGIAIAHLLVNRCILELGFRMKLSSLFAGSTGLALIIIATPLANAQETYFDRDRYTPANERAQPEYDPVPLQVGAFELEPELELGIGSTTNLFAAEQDEVDDVFLLAAPKLTGKTTWSNHEISFDANIRHNEFSDVGEESTTSMAAAVRGRLDASSSLNFTAEVRADQNFEARAAAASVPDALEPVEVDSLGAEIGANFETGRIQITASAAIDRMEYFDVPLRSAPTPLDQDFRDHDQTELRARAAWALNRDVAMFVEGGIIDRDYEAPTPAAPLNRDTTGNIIRIGANFELPVLLRGDVAVGYQTFDFDDPTLSEIDGLSIDGRVQWFVTQLLTLTGSAARTVEDPGLEGTAGAEVTRWGLRGDFEARRNLLLFAEAAFGSFDFEDIDRSDDRIDAAIGATFKLNRRVWLEGSFRHTNQDSDVQEFSDNRLLFALKLHP